MIKTVIGGILMLYKVIGITSVFIMIATSCLQAAWWDGKSIPVPADTVESYQQSRSMLGSEFSLTYYTSSQTADEIKDFYRKKIADLGWHEKKFTADFEKMKASTVKTNAFLGNVMEANLFFEKDNEKLIITFLPKEASGDGKTKFSIAQGKIEMNDKNIEQKNLVPALLAKPQKEVAPNYPGASLFTLSEDSNFLRATYMTKDRPEEAANFYKENMSIYNWSLTNERPFEKQKPDNSALEEAKNNPAFISQKEKIAPMLDSLDTGLSELNFSNDKGDICKITISNLAMPGAPNENFKNITTIMVYYEKGSK